MSKTSEILQQFKKYVRFENTSQPILKRIMNLYEKDLAIHTLSIKTLSIKHDKQNLL